jgi:hypothetical protein
VLPPLLPWFQVDLRCMSTGSKCTIKPPPTHRVLSSAPCKLNSHQHGLAVSRTSRLVSSGDAEALRETRTGIGSGSFGCQVAAMDLRNVGGFSATRLFAGSSAWDPSRLRFAPNKGFAYEFPSLRASR